MGFQQTIRQQRRQKGLKSRELAERMQVSAARVSMLERDEARGAVTLKMLQRAAEALDCRLEYRLVPLAGGSSFDPDAGSTANCSKRRIRLRADDLTG